jgi:hypothetical protein
MRKPLTAAVLALASAGLAVGLSATTAMAATTLTWSVSPGGTISGSAGTTTVKDTTSGLTVTCTSSTLAGSLKSGSGLAGKGLGTVTSLDFNNCSVDGLTLSLSSGTVAWKLNAASYKSGVTHGSISGIHFAISSSECSAVIDGTGATKHNGMVKITYTNSTGKLKVLTAGDNLHVYKVQGCLGAISNGDRGTISSTYTITPKQTIKAS